MGPLIALLFIASSTNQLFVACINSLIAAIPFHFLRLENQFLYTAKQAIMPHAAPAAATDVVAVDLEAPETRKSYDIKTKRIFVQTIEQLVSSGKSCRAACAYAGIPTLYYRRWKKLLTKVDDVNTTDEFVAYSTKGTARKIHHGRTGVLTAIRPQLDA